MAAEKAYTPVSHIDALEIYNEQNGKTVRG
jgi:hypothetical protein